MYFTHFKLGPIVNVNPLPTISEKEDRKKITLAMFNFFGTLAYGDDGRLFNYENTNN